MEHTVSSTQPGPIQRVQPLCRQLLEQYHLPVVSFRLAISSSAQTSAALDRAFQEGLVRLNCALAALRLRPVTQEVTAAPPEGLWVVEGDSQKLKELCAELEEEDELGRLFHLEVLDPVQGQLRREHPGRLDLRSSACAGADCPPCAHTDGASLPDAGLAAAAHFAHLDRQKLGILAAKALLYEVCTTPKPGLVDRNNTGSHRDMDLFTFLDSTAALLPYFEQAAAIGQQTAHLSPHDTFLRLRRAGAAGEAAMFRATGGINTHKGAVFTLGTVCAAAGRLWMPEGLCGDVQALLSLCQQMSARAVEEDFAAMEQGGGTTVGQRLYLTYGMEGIRGELRRGLPSVSQIGLPTLQARLQAGDTLEQAGCQVLLRLMSQVTDTNLIARGGLEGQRWAMARARALTQNGAARREEIAVFDREMIQRNLSPGGCADLLAITYFMHFLQEDVPLL